MGFAVGTDMDNSTLDFVVFATREEAERAANTIKSMASNDRRFDVYETTDPVTATFSDWNCETDNGINESSDAYDTGFEASKQGEGRDANPYPAGTWEAKNWDAGWDAE